MKRTLFLLLMLPMFCLFSCDKDSNDNSIDPFKDLVGAWKYDQPSGYILLEFHSNKTMTHTIGITNIDPVSVTYNCECTNTTIKLKINGIPVHDNTYVINGNLLITSLFSDNELTYTKLE